MLTAVLSDIHDNITNLLAALYQAEKIGCKHLLFTGDIAELSTLRTLREEWEYGIDMVFGNNEWDRGAHIRMAEQFHHLTHHGDVADFILDGRRIFMSHYPQDAEKALRSELYDAIFYGHTHKADLREIGKTLVANPGEICGVRCSPSFAVYDTTSNTLTYHRI